MAAPVSITIAIARKMLPDGSLLFAGLDLWIAAGETVALVGPSGVGKTSLLRCVAGLDSSYVGTIKIRDAAPHAAPAPGMMFQDPRLLPWLTVVENLRLAAPSLTSARAGQRLAELGLPDTIGLYPAQLSLGMQRRVALLRAVIGSPGLLLLDEPFASLDPERREAVQRWLLDGLARTGATMLFTTHDLTDAAQLADRVIALSGRPVVAHELTLTATPCTQRSDTEIADLTRRLRLQLETTHV